MLYTPRRSKIDIKYSDKGQLYFLEKNELNTFMDLCIDEISVSFYLYLKMPHNMIVNLKTQDDIFLTSHL